MTLAVDGLQHVSGELAKDFTKSSASGHTIHPPFPKSGVEIVLQQSRSALISM